MSAPITEQRSSTVTGPADLDPCPSCGTTIGAQSFLDHLTETVTLAEARSVLREIIALADQAPVLTDEQLRFKLLAQAVRVSGGRPVPPPADLAGKWPGDE